MRQLFPIAFAFGSLMLLPAAHADMLEERIAPPDGYERVAAPDGSFAE